MLVCHFHIIKPDHFLKWFLSVIQGLNPKLIKLQQITNKKQLKYSFSQRTTQILSRATFTCQQSTDFSFTDRILFQNKNTTCLRAADLPFEGCSQPTGSSLPPLVYTFIFIKLVKCYSNVFTTSLDNIYTAYT